MPMHNTDRDVLLAETIERILNKLEENNQAALDEAGAFRKFQNLYRSITGRVGDFMKGRFRSDNKKDDKKKDGSNAAPETATPALKRRQMLDKLQEISPGVYYYFVDNTGKYAHSGSKYTFDSFKTFPESMGFKDTVLPIPEGTDLENDLTAKSTTGAVIFDFRFKDLADKLNLSTKAIVARVAEFRFNFITKKWDEVDSRSINMEKLLEYEEKIAAHEYVTTLVKSYSIRLNKRMTGLGTSKYTEQDQEFSSKRNSFRGKYLGMDVSDRAILAIPGMQDAFDEADRKAMERVTGNASGSNEAVPDPRSSAADMSKRWVMSNSLDELGEKIEKAGGVGIARNLLPKIAAEAIYLAEKEVRLTAQKFGGIQVAQLTEPVLSRINGYKDVANWISLRWSITPSLEYLTDYIQFIQSTISNYMQHSAKQIVLATMKPLEKALKDLRAQSAQVDSQAAPVEEAPTSPEVDRIASGEVPSKTWQLSKTIGEAYKKIQDVRKMLIQGIGIDDTSRPVLEEANLLAVLEIIYLHFKAISGDRFKKAPKLNFTSVNTTRKAVEWLTPFIIAVEGLRAGSVSDATIAGKLDAVIRRIEKTSLLDAETVNGLKDELKDIQDRISLGLAYEPVTEPVETGSQTPEEKPTSKPNNRKPKPKPEVPIEPTVTEPTSKPGRRSKKRKGVDY